MARGINKVILIGNLGADPEMRYTSGGDAIANLRMATSESWRDKNTGEQQERTEWHRVVCFRRLGEIAGQYLRKGSKVYIEGRLQTRKWQDQSGQDRWSTEIVANDMQMLDGRSDTANFEQPPEPPPYGDPAPAPASAPPKAAAAAPAAGSSQKPNLDNDFDDDIPF